MSTKEKLIEEIRAVPIAGKTYEESIFEKETHGGWGMKERMSKEELLEFANKVSEYYDFMAKVDSKIRICGYGEGYQKEVHIFSEEELVEIANILGKPIIKAESKRLEVVINNVHLFCLDHNAYESEDTE